MYLPDQPSESEETAKAEEEEDLSSLDRQDSVTRVRTDILRRKSEFLGLKESQEYKHLQEGKLSFGGHYQ